MSLHRETWVTCRYGRMVRVLQFVTSYLGLSIEVELFTESTSEVLVSKLRVLPDRLRIILQPCETITALLTTLYEDLTLHGHPHTVKYHPTALSTSDQIYPR